MALKDEAWRLDPAGYPARQLLHTRFGDMDANAHLNNVAIAGLFEEARVRTLSALRADTQLSGPAAVMIVHLAIDYLAEAHYPNDVESGLAVTAIGRTSFHLGLGLFQHGRAVALATCAMVHLGADRAPAAIGDALRARLEALAPNDTANREIENG
jgi:acyl-CoA thioester hydrolase